MFFTPSSESPRRIRSTVPQTSVASSSRPPRPRIGAPASRRRRQGLAALALAATMASPLAMTGTRGEGVARAADGQVPVFAAAAMQDNQTPPAGTGAAAESQERPPMSKADVKKVYNQARDEFNRGDWINARKHFEIARDYGYRPGLFEDSPSKYLSRMDAKENADRARTEKQMAQQQAAAANAQPTGGEQPAGAQPTEGAAAAAAAPAVTPAPPPENAAQPNTAPAPAPTDTAAAQQPSNNAQPTQPAPAPSVTTTTTPPPPSNPTPAPAPEVGATVTATAPGVRESGDMQRIRSAQNVADARRLVQQADAAANAQPPNYDEAMRLYSQAAQLDPNNAQAQNGINAMAQFTGRGAAPNPLDQRQREIEARRQYIRYAFDTSINDASNAINAGNWADATNAINRARLNRNSEPSIFTPEEIAGFDRRIGEIEARFDRQRSAVTSAQQTQETAEAAKLEAQRQQQADAARRRTVHSLIDQSRRLTDQGKYEQALGVVDQILAIDPGNDYAVGVRPLIEDRALFQEQRRYREDFDRQLTRQLNASEEKRIPYMDILRYPENWPDLSATRDLSVAQERGEVQGDAQITAQLERKLPDVRFDAVAFTDVVDFLRDITQTNIFVNWRALEAAGVDKNAPVTTRLRDVKFSKVLRTVLDEVGGGTVRLGYTIDEGVITISTDEDLSRNVATRVYDIRDLIINVPDFDNAPDFNITQANSGGGGRGGGGGGGQNLFGGGGGSNQQDNQNGPTRQELVDSIVRLIQDTVATESWKDNGGTVGSVRELSGQLIVTQTPENQRQLVRLLEQLRETRAIQVTVEARFLKVQRNFLEDIGVDFNFRFNNVSDKINNGGPITFTQNSAGFTQASNLDTTLPGNLATVLTGSSLSTAISYIDDFQVAAIIRATQATQTSSTITAPRVTLFNGQRAYVLVATSRAYVSDLNPVVGSNAVGFDPTISTVQSGVLLDVQATVSSDRKYVTLTLRPQLSNLLQLVPFGIGGTTIIPGGLSAATQPFSAQGVIQQPETQITEVRTTVSVPDGGTLLLGGQTIGGELEREAGVPILSKIPFLKRLFTNRSMAKDDQVLLILVKPTIIIQREQEQRQFPLLNTKTTG